MKHYEAYAAKLIEEAKIPGAFIGIAKDGKHVFTKGIGYQNSELQTEITLDTVFGIGSITKSFTCVAIMQLQEAGKLSVDEPVVKYLPEFRTKGEARTKRITIAHLMSHTSGLPSLPTLTYALRRSIENDQALKDNGNSFDLTDHEPIDTYEQLMDFIADQDFEFLGEPGTEFSYSNDGYALLGAIIERVSGKSYERYIKEHLLDPAGMKQTVFLTQDLGDCENITTLYTSKHEENEKVVFDAPLWWDAPSMRAAGFLKSTGRDMLAYAEIFRTGGTVGEVRILSDTSVNQMIGKYIEFQPDRYYGYGFMIRPDFRGGTLIEHAGSLKGISAQLCIVPEHGTTSVILTNLDGAPSRELMTAAMNTAQSLQLDTPFVTYNTHSVSPDALKAYVGKYQSGEGETIEVSIGEKGLQLILQGKRIPLCAVGEDSFVMDIDNGLEKWIRFNRNDAGYVNRVHFHLRQLLKVGQEVVNGNK